MIAGGCDDDVSDVETNDSCNDDVYMAADIPAIDMVEPWMAICGSAQPRGTDLVDCSQIAHMAVEGIATQSGDGVKEYRKNNP
jgi:hypothetical protein